MATANIIRFSALLLAGGQGSRLAGKDKGLMPWRGQPVAAGLSATLGYDGCLCSFVSAITLARSFLPARHVPVLVLN